ncbi:hypothetical protein KDH_25140 [Dictyobacter sp. S3.2.2.5]|uniref:Methyltransferase domain-containing protein n=1 Tax=Dictyobacter halimunensis TaxID=3026934 RepID=A0ABQ6FPR1_9CHLR|nr:hypothetical protein KDH_25140 [Dictyobacter sp. S3.2.2.5]
MEERDDTYLADPDSGLEMTRLIEQDRLLTRGMGGVLPEFEALPPDVTHILDVGCGPGGWVLDVAYTYPNCEVVGLDVSEQMIYYAQARAKAEKRPNAIFVRENILQPLAFVEGEFDLVNIRLAATFILRDAWPSILLEISRALRPGGIIRMTESDKMSVNPAPTLEKLLQRSYQMVGAMGYGFASDGKGLGVASAMAALLAQAGFVDVQAFPHPIDFSASTELHKSQYDNFIVTFTTLLPLLLHQQVMTQAEFEATLNQVRIEMLRDDFQGTWHMLTTIAKKPT